jgi:hypothetical protein
VLLSKLLKNILDNPEQEKYRRVKLSNQKVNFVSVANKSVFVSFAHKRRIVLHLTSCCFPQLQEKLFSFTVTFWSILINILLALTPPRAQGALDLLLMSGFMSQTVDGVGAAGEADPALGPEEYFV